MPHFETGIFKTVITVGSSENQKVFTRNANLLMKFVISNLIRSKCERAHELKTTENDEYRLECPK